jgi:predicted DNA-binding protein
MPVDTASTEDIADSGAPGRVTYARSVRLTADVIERLSALCDHLGVTPGAYMTAAIGKCLAQDEVAFHTKQQTRKQVDALSAFMASFVEDVQQRDKE